MMRWILLLLLFSLGLPGLAAQEAEETAESPENLITYGQVITGQINNNTPQTSYVFEALRCDFLSVHLRATSGNLDPVLSIFDSDDQLVLSQDDTRGSIQVDIEPLAIPASGTYTIVVARFGYRLGSTNGAYELFVERIGNGSASGCAMRYGDTVTNNLSDQTPEAWYRFTAQRGDIVNLEMRSIGGTLDPVLTVVDAGGYIMASNDDSAEGDINSRIGNLLIPADGDYFVRASRYSTTSGAFVLTLGEAANSGIGNSALAAIPVRANSTVEGTLGPDLTAQYYRLEARQNDVLSVSMNRLSANLDPLIIIMNADQQELIEDDDSGGNQNSRIEEFLIPADGTYYIVATRFERELGRTGGRYELQIQGRGNAFDDLPADVLRLSYPITVTGNIDNITPEIRYAFWAVEGSRVTINMSRTAGELDPLLRLLSRNEATLVTDNDSGRNNNAEIVNYLLPNTGIYIISATRFNQDQNNTGTYVLTLEVETPPPPEP